MSNEDYDYEYDMEVGEGASGGCDECCGSIYPGHYGGVIDGLVYCIDCYERLNEFYG